MDQNSDCTKITSKYTNPANPVRNFCKQKLRPLPGFFLTTEETANEMAGLQCVLQNVLGELLAQILPGTKEPETCTNLKKVPLTGGA